jgi:hypothetical protein
MTINEIELKPFKAQVDTYILRKQVVMDESYSVEDVLIVGLRTLDREKKWQLKHGSQSQKEKIDKLKKAITDLGGNPEDYTAKM